MSKQRSFICAQAGFAPILHLIIGLAVGIALVELLSFYYHPLNSTTLPPTLITTTNKTITNQAAGPGTKLDLQKLNKYLSVEAALLGLGDNMSLYFKDLNNPNSEVTLDPTRSWIPASTIKSYVALEAYRQRDLGLINFNQLVTIPPENVVPTELETEDYPRLREGTKATINDLLGAMITQSDNTAYNTLLDVLDRRNINNTLKALGLTETVVGEKLNLDSSQFQKDLEVAGRQPNTTTVKDFASFFDLLYIHQVADAEEILAVFKKQKINNMIPALLPQNTLVAHKTGDWAPIYHDGGVVYKPNQPFILTVFTNANNPSAVAQIAKVAFYDDAQSVGQDIVTPDKKTTLNLNTDKITLAESNSQTEVLSETTQKFPEITAEDLGITANDLSLFDNQNAKKISSALITPDLPLYGFKRVLEIIAEKLPGRSQNQVERKLTQTQNRLSELKTTLNKGNLQESEKLLAESEQNLSNAVQSAQKKDSTNVDLTSVKQVNDLHYATLAESAKNIPSNKKEQFIDMVYRFKTQNEKEVKPIVAKSVVANPLQQKPLIGTIQKTDDKNITVQFDDGSQKQLNVSTFTPVRDFHSERIDNKNDLQEGSKIAVIGQAAKNGVIVPQFILKNIPHELPDRHEGTVVEIDPKDKILKIREKGNLATIQVGESTIVKGSDTSVSLEGIKAGSKVRVYGEYQATPAATLKPFSSFTTSSSSLPQPKPSGTVGPVGKTSSAPSIIPKPAATTTPNQNSTSGSAKSTPAPTPQNNNTQQSQTIIKATTISITGNSSGKNETTQPKAPTPPPAPPSPPKPAAPQPPPPAPAPTKK